VNDKASQISKKRSERQKKEKGAAKRQKRLDFLEVSWKTLAAAGAVWLGTVLLLSLGQNATYLINLTPGQQISRTVVSEVRFECLDMENTGAAREAAADRVAPVYSRAPNDATKALGRANGLLDKLESLAETMAQAPPRDVLIDGGQPAENDPVFLAVVELTNTFAELGITAISPASIQQWTGSNQLNVLRTALPEALAVSMALPILEPEHEVDSIQLLGADEETLVEWKRDALHAPDKVAARLVTDLQQRLGPHTLPPGELDALAAALVIPNLRFDKSLTEREKTIARREVESVFETVSPGDIIASTGEEATPQVIEKLEAHKRQLGLRSSPLLKLISNGAMLLAALFILGGILLITQPSVLRKPKLILLAGLLAIIPLAAARGLGYLEGIGGETGLGTLFNATNLVVLIPIAIAPLLATLLWNSRYGVAVGLWTSFVVAILVEQSFLVFLLGLVVTIIASLTVRDLHKRSSLLKAGLFLGLAQAVFVVGVAGRSGIQSFEQFLPQIGLALLNGALVAGLAIVFVPIFEWVFRMTSPIKMLELLDMRHPLIERLMLEAPGTYHHSLQVANLAQAAASEIGVNDLLVRVAALYHDIGKMVKPPYFIENTSQGRNPHDDLSPTMSTLLIIAHVKEGVSLARTHKLPQPIIDGIQTHHGTQAVSYFYHRAKEQAEEDSEGSKSGGNGNSSGVSIDDFRYPGPLPETPEMAILMLADSIEAASRTLDNPTASNIAELVNKIIREKLNDNQLDKCKLTFAQLSEIKKSFIYTLTSMLHHRVKYPKDEDRTDQPTIRDPDPGRTDSESAPVAHAPGSGA